MDVDKIFNLFDDKKLEEIPLGGMENPYLKIGMFNKIILNKKNFSIKMKRHFPPGVEFDIKKFEHSSNFVVFNRAYFYIKDINIEDKVHLDALRCYDLEMLIKNLQELLNFFVEREEYEKCAILHKIEEAISSF